MGFIDEAVNDFYKKQTFYSSAKSFKPELKKQIIAFFRKKGIDGYKDSYDFYPNFDYNKDTKLPAEKKRKEFHNVHKEIEIKDKFFSVNSGYDAKISFPKMFKGDMRWELEISSNENFFEQGHDVKVKINTLKGGYETAREFDYKVNLLRPIPIVLEDIWQCIEKSITDFNETEKPPKEDRYKSSRKYVKSDIQRIVSLYLDRQYKTYKSGKKVEIDDYDKKPVTFYVDMKGKNNKNFSSHAGRGQEGFTLRIGVKKLKKNTESAGYGRNSREVIKPELKERFPGCETWGEILKVGKEEITGQRVYGGFGADFLFGAKAYGEDHMKIWDRLQLATRKFIKLGYFPTGSSTPYKQGEDAKIEFKRDASLVAKVQKNPALIDRIMKNKKYSSHIRKAFFYKGQDPNTVYLRCLEEIFSWNK